MSIAPRLYQEFQWPTGLLELELSR